MKYLPAINLWDNATHQAVLSGQIKLQAGQWVRCGNGRLSRFVRTTGRSIWVAHWQGSADATEKRFKALLKASK